MEKILGIVKNAKDVEKISKKIKELNASCLLINISSKPIKSDLPIKNKSDFINETKILNDLADEIRNMSFNWNMVSFEEVKKLSMYDSIPLWECTYLHFELVLRSLIPNIEVIKKIVEDENPSLFFVVDSKDLLSNTIITTLNELKAKYKLIEDDFGNKFSNRLKDKYKLIAGKYLKPIVIDYLIKLKTLNKVTFKNHGNKKIMFFSYLNLDTQIMIPVIKELKKQNKSFLVLSLALDVQKGFLKNNIDFNTFADYKIEETESARKKQKDFKQIWEILNQDKRFMYKDINLWNILKDEIYYTIFKHFREVVRLIDGIKVVIQNEKIEVVIMGSDVHRFGKTVGLVSNKLGLKSIVMQHGVAGRLGFLPVTCTKIAVWGNATKRFLIQNDVANEKIEVIGSPKFDTIKNITYDKEALYKELNLDKDKKILLLGTQTVPEKEAMFNCVVNSLNDEQLIIKLHPKDDMNFYNSRLANLKLKNRILVIKDYDIYKLFNIANLTISRASSTVVIESMLFNVPVITLNLANIKGSMEMIDYTNYKCVIEVKDQKEMKKAIADLLNNKKVREKIYRKMKKFVDDYAYKVDGKSSERMNNLVENLTVE